VITASLSVAPGLDSDARNPMVLNTLALAHANSAEPDRRGDELLRVPLERDCDLRPFLQFACVETTGQGPPFLVEHLDVAANLHGEPLSVQLDQQDAVLDVELSKDAGHVECRQRRRGQQYAGDGEQGTSHEDFSDKGALVRL